MSDFAQLINDAFGNGSINQYMRDKLTAASESGLTDSMFEQALDDACSCTKAGVDNEGSFRTRFFVVNMADDMLDDTFGKKVTPDERDVLCEYILGNQGKDYPLDNLTDFRILMHKWLCDRHTKTAHPNTMGKDSREPVYNTDKWVDTIKIVYSLTQGDVARGDAIDTATSDWTADERFKFDNWLRYYESKNTEKYNVKSANLKKEALDIAGLGLPANMLDPATRSNNLESLNQPAGRHRKTKKDKELELARAIKRKMKARLVSIKRLLDKYNDILPHQSVESVQDEMYALDKSLSKLNIFSSVQDRIIRAAHVVKRAGWAEGAEMLYKVAEDTIVPTAVDASPAPEVIESLPDPVSAEPDLPTGSESLIDVKTIIMRLEGISKKLKSRDTIRELASIDILLNELGMASFFPELTDAQSKLIESYGYSSNKIESIVAKLRGTGTSKPAPAKPAPAKPAAPKADHIDKRQLQQQPVSNVKKELPKA